MAKIIGAHNERIGLARELLSTKGRRAQARFAFEGQTLLDEAVRSNLEIAEVFATDNAYSQSSQLGDLEASGVPVYLVDDRTMSKLSDVEKPQGLVCIAHQRFISLTEITAERLWLVLADINDPGNAGTLLRSAEAFGAGGVIFGNLGVDPYSPKVVRGAMGALFRLKLAVANPDEVRAVVTPSTPVFGLAAGGDDIRGVEWGAQNALVVGNERRGLGAWEALCTRLIAIPMSATTESLNASVAGSLALYEASKRDALR